MNFFRPFQIIIDWLNRVTRSPPNVIVPLKESEMGDEQWITVDSFKTNPLRFEQTVYKPRRRVTASLAPAGPPLEPPGLPPNPPVFLSLQPSADKATGSSTLR